MICIFFREHLLTIVAIVYFNIKVDFLLILLVDISIVLNPAFNCILLYHFNRLFRDAFTKTFSIYERWTKFNKTSYKSLTSSILLLLTTAFRYWMCRYKNCFVVGIVVCRQNIQAIRAFNIDILCFLSWL